MHYFRSALFVPANNPSMIQSSELLLADAIIFDLEDAIDVSEKDSARILLDEAFTFFKKSNVIRIVRVNPFDTEYFYDDVKALIKHDIDYIMLAKADVEGLKALETLLKDTNIKIIALIESAYGVYNLSNIIQASTLVKGVLFGAEDYALDMQIVRTKLSNEIEMARQHIAMVARAFNVFAIDTPFTDVLDEEFLVLDVMKARSVGFSSKACIHPSQVTIVNDVFSPSNEEIKHSLEVIEASAKAKLKGLGVFSHKGKMVDAPIINRAFLTLENAKKAGVYFE